LVPALAVLANTAYAADEIDLVCSGTSSERIQTESGTTTSLTPAARYTDMHIQIDLAKKKVWVWWTFPMSITSLSEDSVYFGGNTRDGDAVQGNINRITGETKMETPHVSYLLTCKPWPTLF
jgi:hypothetical protein